MSTGSVRSCPPSGGPITSVTSQPLVHRRSKAVCEPYSFDLLTGLALAGRQKNKARPERFRVSRESLGYSSGGLAGERLDVQEPHVLGVARDEGAAGLDVLAHQHAEQLVGLRGVVQGHLEQHPAA